MVSLCGCFTVTGVQKATIAPMTTQRASSLVSSTPNSGVRTAQRTSVVSVHDLVFILKCFYIYFCSEVLMYVIWSLFSGLSLAVPSKLFLFHLSSSITISTISTRTSPAGSRAHVPSAAAPAQTGPCPEPKRHRALLVRRRNRPQLCRRGYLSPVRLSPGQPGGGSEHRPLGSDAVEEDWGSESAAFTHGVHFDPVCVGVNILFCRQGERCVRPLRAVLRAAVHWRH